jgi:hypothetical protein
MKTIKILLPLFAMLFFVLACEKDEAFNEPNDPLTFRIQEDFQDGATQGSFCDYTKPQ